MQANQNVTVNPTESNPIQPEASSGTQKAKSRLRTYKRKQNRLKAAIRLLKEELADSREETFKCLDKLCDERQMVKELMAEKNQITSDTMNAVLEAENKVHEARKAASAVERPLFDAFFTLSRLMARLSQESH